MPDQHPAPPGSAWRERRSEGLQWGDTHPEDAPWVHARDQVGQPGAAPDTEPPFDAEDWSARLIDVLENRVMARLEDLSRRVAQLEADRDLPR